MFDPNAVSMQDSGIFGLPDSEETSSLIYLPVPWEATTSYGGGTAKGPSAILKASHQVDLYDIDVLRPYEAGLFMLPESEEVKKWNHSAKAAAERVIAAATGESNEPADLVEEALEIVNRLGEKLNQYVYRETQRVLKSGRIVGVVGGDHSVPFGAIQAISEKHSSFGILHFDAHADLRKAYEGFTWSHASIMNNVLDQIPQVSRIVQVGIRDFCEEEYERILAEKNRLRTFFDRDLAHRKYNQIGWAKTCQDIIAELPDEVWISFDIDGLDPRFCPNTGTPVPGGLDFQEAVFLIAALARSGKRIIGFDLNEVAPDLFGLGVDSQACSSREWDANVGARLLYKLSGLTLLSQRKVLSR